MKTEEKTLQPEDLKSIKKKSVSGAISYFIRTLALNGIGIVSALILSAYFRPEDFGIYGIVIQIIGLLVFFSDVGLAAALIQKKTEPTIEDYRTTFTVQQLLSWLIVGITVIIAQLPFINDKVGSTGIWILYSLAISFPLASLKTIPSVILERQLLFSKLVIPQIFEQIAFHGLLIFLAISGQDAIAYAYAILARSIIGVVTMYFLQKWEIGFLIDRNSLKSLLNFGVRFQLNDFIARIKDQLFYIALGIFLPLREFGYVQWAKNWSLYPYNLTVQNVMAITFPTFARLQHDHTALRKAIETSLFFITLAIFPILVGMCVFIVPFISVFPVYEKWSPAVLSLVLFTLSIAWSAISSPLTNTLSAIGNIDKTLKLMVIWTILTWILTPLLIYFFGYNGVALAAFVISFTSYLAVRYVKKIIDFNLLDQTWRQIIAAGVMSLVGLLGQSIWSRDILSLAFGIILAAFTFLGTFLWIGRKKLSLELKRIGLTIPYLTL